MNTVNLARDGHTLIIEMNRPEARNALSLELRGDLAEAFAQANADSGVRAVVLTGVSKSFCAGLDLRELREAPNKSVDEHLADSRSLGELFGAISFCRVPVIAAVNGHAVAGGAGFVAAADLAVMSSEAKLGFTEVKIGFIPALVSALLLPQISRKLANDLFMSGRLLTAEEAERGGLVNELAKPEHVLDRTLEIARTVSENAPTAVQTTKALMHELAARQLEQTLAVAAQRNAEARTNPELTEGIVAFLEKRTPSWRDTLN